MKSALPARSILSLIILVIFFNCSGQNNDPKNYSNNVRKYDSLSFANHLSNPSISLFYANQAMNIAEKSGREKDICLASTAMGNAYSREKKDSAFYYYSHALDLAVKNKLAKLIPQLLFNLSGIYESANDYTNAIRLMDSCIRVSERNGDFPALADALNSLGGIQMAMNDSGSAKQTYQRGLQIAEIHHLRIQQARILGNLANFVTSNESYIGMIRKAISCLDQPGKNDEEKSQLLINLGTAMADPDSALTYYHAALSVVGNSLPSIITISSYNNMAYAFLKKNEVVRAESCIRDSALPLAKSINSFDWMSSLYDTYADIMIARTYYNNAVRFEKMSREMKLKDDDLKAKSQMRLLVALLDVRNKEMQIIQARTDVKLKSNQNEALKLQLSLAILSIIAGMALFFLYKQWSNNRYRKEQIASAKRLIEIEESEKAHIGRELHDRTGYLLQVIENWMATIAHPENSENERVKLKVQEMGLAIRRISHRMSLVNQTDSSFSEVISSIITDITRLTGNSIHYFCPELPEPGDEQKLHLYRILEELLTNASKYARKYIVTINFASVDNCILLHYEDTGPGFDMKEPPKQGLGIKSILTRVKLLNGKVELKSTPGAGTSWDITAPLYKKSLS
jgi:two-component system, NarL family, sensor kinase